MTWRLWTAGINQRQQRWTQGKINSSTDNTERKEPTDVVLRKGGAMDPHIASRIEERNTSDSSISRPTNVMPKAGRDTTKRSGSHCRKRANRRRESFRYVSQVCGFFNRSTSSRGYVQNRARPSPVLCLSLVYGFVTLEPLVFPQ